MPLVHAADQLPGAIGVEAPAAVFARNDGSPSAGGGFDRFREAAAAYTVLSLVFPNLVYFYHDSTMFADHGQQKIAPFGAQKNDP